MFGMTSRRTHRPAVGQHRQRRGFFHRTNPNRRAAGLKAALHNPNTSTSGRREAKFKLNAMGRGRDAHVPLSVRIKHMFGIRNHHTHNRRPF